MTEPLRCPTCGEQLETLTGPRTQCGSPGCYVDRFSGGPDVTLGPCGHEVAANELKAIMSAAHWPLDDGSDGIAADVSGHGHDGRYRGSG